MADSALPVRRKASQHLMAQRIAELIVFITTAPRYQHEIVKYCADKWGIRARHAADLTTRAIATIRNEHPLDRATMTQDAMARLDQRIKKGMSDRDYVRAEELRANIAGYLAPKQVEVAQYHVQAGRAQHQVDWSALKQVACAAQGVTPLAIAEQSQPTIELASVSNPVTALSEPAVQSPQPIAPRKRIEASDVPPLKAIPAYGEPILIEPPTDLPS